MVLSAVARARAATPRDAKQPTGRTSTADQTGVQQCRPNRPRRPPLHLRVGEIVEVRSEAEILATLDERGELDGLPFMPEMLDFCGRRFRVHKLAAQALRHHWLDGHVPHAQRRAP